MNTERPPSAQILIVEDDPGISSMLKTILEEEGYRPTIAGDGTSALAFVDKIVPDLVLLDLKVPHKSGFEILKHIRQKDRDFGLFIPVIILTGVYTSREDKVRVLTAGADDFVHKPFDLVELLARVRSLIRVKDLYKRAQYLASHDHLTRCYNRAYLLDFMARELARFKRYKKSYTYLLLDLDHFKQVNDELGHEAGDQVLSKTGFLLQDFFRAVDCVARLGGDEFAIVLPDTDAATAAQVAGRLMAFVASPQNLHTFPAPVRPMVGFSLGVASLPEHSDNNEDLMRRADGALYEAKRAGRNTYRVAS